MEKWKPLRASHFSTPPTAMGLPMSPLRYTNYLLGTFYRALHSCAKSKCSPHFGKRVHSFPCPSRTASPWTHSNCAVQRHHRDSARDAIRPRCRSRARRSSAYTHQHDHSLDRTHREALQQAVVRLPEIENWLTRKVLTIHAALKGQDRYSSAEFTFEFWTAPDGPKCP